MIIKPTHKSGNTHALPEWVVLGLFFFVPLFLAAILVSRLFMPAGGGLDVSGYQIGRDFINVWIGSQLAFSGHVDVAYDFAAYQTAIKELFGQTLPYHVFSYPPHSLLLYWPFAHLPYFWGLALWTAAGLAALTPVVLSQLPRAKWPLALALLFCSPAVIFNGLVGQNGCFSSALLVGGVVIMDRRPLMAGVLFGLLTFKPHLGLVLVFALIALRGWKTIASAALTAGLLATLSVALFGTEPWVQYLTATRQIQMLFLYDMDGFYVYMMPSWFSPLRTAGLSYPATMTIQAVLTVAVIALSWQAVTRTQDTALRALIIASATPLALPYSFNYDLAGIAIAMVWLLTGRLPLAPELRLPLLFAWLAPFLSVMNVPLHQLALTPAALTWLFGLSILMAARSGPVPLSRTHAAWLNSPAPQG